MPHISHTGRSAVLGWCHPTINFYNHSCTDSLWTPPNPNPVLSSLAANLTPAWHWAAPCTWCTCPCLSFAPRSRASSSRSHNTFPIHTVSCAHHRLDTTQPKKSDPYLPSQQIGPMHGAGWCNAPGVPPLVSPLHGGDWTPHIPDLPAEGRHLHLHILEGVLNEPGTLNDAALLRRIISCSVVLRFSSSLFRSLRKDLFRI